jgi:hypothetical protein
LLKVKKKLVLLLSLVALAIGVFIARPMSIPIALALHCAFSLCVIGLVSAWSKGRLRIQSCLAGILVVTAALFYFSETGPFDRGYDAAQHVDVVNHWTETNGERPHIKSKLHQAYHPPVYYFTGYIYRKIFPESGVRDARLLQVLGFTMFVFSMLAFLLIHDRYFKFKLGFIGICLAFLIPGHLFLSARVNNDSAALFFGTLALLAVIIFQSERKLWQAAVVGILAMLALASKLSALPIVLACLAVVILPGTFFSKREKAISAALIALPSFLFMIYWVNINKSETGQWIYSNSVLLPHHLLIPKTISRVLSFDFSAFFHQPIADPWGGQIRDSFGSFFFTTMLQGEFPFRGYFSEWLGWWRLPFLVAIIPALYLQRHIQKLWKDPVYRTGIIVSLGGTAFIALYSYRYPFSCSQDYRYITYVTPFLVAATASGLTFENPKVKLAFKLYGLFLVLLCLLFVAAIYLRWTWS